MRPRDPEHHYEEPVDPDLDPAHLAVVLVVSVGGGAGAVARFAAYRTAPDVWVTLAVNLAGCALIGVLVVLTTEVWQAHPLIRPFLGTGVLGGFTTFSTYAVGIRDLLDAGEVGAGLAYLAVTPLAALAAVWAAASATRRVLIRRQP